MEFSLINLLLVLLVAWVSGVAFSRLGYPAILGELAAGIVFGPPMLGWVYGSDGLAILAELGVFLLLLYIGMEVNYRELARASATGLFTALGGFAVPCAAGYLFALQRGETGAAGLVLGLTMGVTSLAVLSRILVDMKLLGTRLANVMIAAAVITDTLGLLGFAILLALTGQPEFAWGALALSLGKAVLFFGVTILAGLKVFPLVGDLLKRTGVSGRTANFTLVLLIGLVFAELANVAGLHSILGAFLAGMFIRSEVLMRKMSHEVTTMVRDLSLGFLAPIFFVTAGFHVDLAALAVNWPLALSVVVLATVAKVLGTAVCYLPSRKGWREALAIGLGMNGHGAVEIIVAEIALDAGVIGPSLFSIIVFTAFATTATVPLALKLSVRWLRRRGELARATEHRNGVIIAGASPLARLIAAQLSPSEPVWLVDTNPNRCRAAEAEGLRAYHGSSLSEHALDMVHASEARSFLALTANPHVNMQTLNNAHTLFAVPDLFTVRPTPASDSDTGDQDDDEDELIHDLYWRDLDMDDWNRWIARQATEEVTRHIEGRLSREQFFTRMKHIGLLPLVVLRGSKRLLPAALDHIEAGDTVVGIQKREVAEAHDLFDELVRTCPILDLKAVAVEEFFREVSDIMAEKLGMSAKDVYSQLVRREMESTTMLVPGLAIPHVIVPQAREFAMVIARSKEGVAFFESEANAHIIFVLAGPEKERNKHLRLLSAIAQLFQEPAFEDTLMSVENPDEMRDVILGTERRRF